MALANDRRRIDLDELDSRRYPTRGHVLVPEGLGSQIGIDEFEESQGLIPRVVQERQPIDAPEHFPIFAARRQSVLSHRRRHEHEVQSRRAVKPRLQV